MKLSNIVTILLAVLLLTKASKVSAFDNWHHPLSENEHASIEIINGMIKECGNEAGCVVERFAEYVSDQREERTFETGVLKKLGTEFETYACSDKDSVTSEAIRRDSWRDFNVDVLHERTTGKVHLIENFIGEDECQAILDIADKAALTEATVEAAKRHNTKIRKVLQTNIQVPWDKEEEGHPIARVSRRVFDYTNDVLAGLNIDHHGQSTFKFLHYSGRGRNETEPDHYSTHCDGECGGSQHRKGGRVATMLMYCETPEDGGHTHFRHAGVHIAAKPGDALFFSYIDPETMKMDDGYSVHSGCPVYEGDKKIVTQWMRYGVSEEEPYNSPAFSNVY